MRANGGPLMTLNGIKLNIASGAGDDTVRISSWTGTSTVTIDAGAGLDAIDLSYNTTLSTTVAVASMSGVESLNLSHASLSSLPGLPTTLTSLDLRYNNFKLGDPTAFSASQFPSSLASLFLYGNPSIDSSSAPADPDLQALKGKLLRVDLAPVGLEQAESLFKLDSNGNVIAKTQDEILNGIVKALHYLPLEIFDYVHNNYAFELYRGSMKGTLGLIQTHAGNDYEQAQLLKTLFDQLQSTNITSDALEYTAPSNNNGIDLSADVVMAWLGVRTPEAAKKLLTLSNIYFPTTYVDGSGKITGFRIAHSWLSTTIGGTTLRFDPSWKFKTYSSPDAAFISQSKFQDLRPTYSAGDRVSQKLGVDFTNPVGNAYYAAPTTQVAYEWFQDRVSDFLSENSSGLTLADLKYDGPINPILTTRDSVAQAFPFPLSGVTVQNVTTDERWRVVLGLDYQSGSNWVAITSQPLTLAIADYSLTPIELTWDASGKAVLNSLKLDGTTQALFTAQSGLAAGTITRLNIGFIKPGDTAVNESDSLTKTVPYERKVGVDMAVGLEANQLTDEFIANLQRIVNADAISTGWNSPTNFTQSKIANLLALSVNKFFRRTDQGQDSLDTLFHTVQVRGSVAAGVASSDSPGSSPTAIADFRSDLQLPYLPKNLFVDIRQFRADAIAIDTKLTTGLDAPEKFRFDLAAASSSSQESGIWEELANNDAMSTVKSFQLARSHKNASGAAAPIAIVTYTKAQWDTAKTGQTLNGLTSGEKLAVDAVFDVTKPNPASNVTIPSASTDLNGWSGVGFLAIYPDKSEGWIIVGAAGTTGQGGIATINGYMPPPLIPNTFSADLGDPINAATGAVVEDLTDISIPTKGLPLTFARHYDSSTSGDGTLGKGWWGSYSDHIIASGNDVIWTDSQGHDLKFTYDSTNPTLYKNPESIFGEFRKDSTTGTYTFRGRDGLAYKFNSLAAGTVDPGAVRNPRFAQ